MSSVKRASAAGVSSPLVRGLSAVALTFTAGCSADLTRFEFFGDASQHPPGKATYAPPGYQTGSTGKGVKESSLEPVEKMAKAPPESYGPPSSGTAPWHIKTADAGTKSPYGPSPWSWANHPPPKWSGKPLWTDEESFPWPGAQDKEKTAQRSFQGHYTTRRGDTLPAIAERYKVSLAELKRVNGISEQAQVRVGTVLAIPARGGAGVAPPSTTPPPRVVQVKPVIDTPSAPKVASLAPPAPVPAPKTALKQSGAASDDTRSLPETAGVKFRWPVLGKVISTFGPQADGAKNEGIKMSVPLGTDVHAAEGGRIHYAGDGLKGYGNLILIRHPNGWVSTYAHADKMLVKVGDEVKRGQVIAKAGKTGAVAQPQLGFELRKGSVPVDPLEHLAR
jgi:murein DD-endopeptidase MepM/ murein hydrolase activator NlpD